MSDIDIRITGHAGHITLRRPKALNALTYAQIPQISAALSKWADDDRVALVIIDAEGDKAFCAGGDIADLYAAGCKGDYSFGQRFWRDEYRLNAQIAEYAKPIATFLQGFTMGGGVGIGCHASSRVVGDTSRIAMPECGIGLVPDVGGSRLLAMAPGRLGEYLGLTAARMEAGDAIHAGFADHYLPEDTWPALIEELETTGDISAIPRAAQPAPPSKMQEQHDIYERFFDEKSLADIAAKLDQSDSDFATATLKALSRNSPLSMACGLDLIRQVRNTPTIRAALTLEYRFTARATEHGDFIEGIRAAIIDKTRDPRWKHDLTSVTEQDIEQMMAPLGDLELTWE